MAGIDYKKLRESNPRDITLYFREAIKRQSDTEVARHVFEGIEKGLLPTGLARDLLRATKCPLITKDAIVQKHSLSVRKFGLNFLERLLSRSDPIETLKVLGGEEWLSQLFHNLSVDDVKILSKALCLGTRKRSEEMEGLFDSLHASLVATSALENRRLFNSVSDLLPACSAGYVEVNLSDDQKLSSACTRRLIIRHTTFCRQKVLNAVNFPKVSLPYYASELVKNLPSLPTDARGLTPSKEFALEVLSNIADKYNITADVSDNFTRDTLILPLARRVYNKDGESDQHGTMLEILHYTAAIMERGSNFVDVKLSFKKGYLGWFAVKCWSSNASKFDQKLRTLLKNLRAPLEELLNRLPDCFAHIPVCCRKQLLDLIFQCYSPKFKDLFSSESLKEINLLEWPKWIFRTLPRVDALRVFNNLRGIYQERDKPFLKPIYPIITSPETNVGILHTCLERGEIGALERAAVAIQHLQKHAEKARNQIHRETHTSEAICYAIESGSLELLLGVIKWTRRFVKDTLTVPTIFIRTLVNNQDVVDMLAVLPSFRYSQGVPYLKFRQLAIHAKEDLDVNVAIANEILRTIFSFAVSTLQEPSSDIFRWLPLFRLSAKISIQRIREIEMHYSADCSQIRSVFESTKVLLLETESRLLDLGEEHVFNTNPTKMDRYPLPLTKRAQPLTLEFLDDLAKCRDKIWYQLRVSERPEISNLPSPFSHGLPLIKLLQSVSGPNNNMLDLGLDCASPNVPFLKSRAHELVFMPAEIALSNLQLDKDSANAVTCFLDSYAIALRFYALSYSVEEQPDAIQRAWKHCLANFNGSRMTNEESRMHWMGIFQGALSNLALDSFDTQKLSANTLIVPTVTSSPTPIKWSPEIPYQEFTKKRKTAFRNIDFLTNGYLQIRNSGIYYAIRDRGLKIGADSEKSFDVGAENDRLWSLSRKDNSPLKNEVAALSAMLFLDCHFKSSESILACPFPSQAEIRYPCMILDEGFLSDKNRTCDKALDVIQKSIGQVSPALLSDLVRNAFKSLLSHMGTSVFAERKRQAFSLLKLLIESDRPSLASQLVLEAVLNYPEDTAWHRQILTQKILRRMDPVDAQHLIIQFVSEISSRLGSPTSLQYKQHQSAPESFVKVSTVKLLIGLLSNTETLPPSLTLTAVKHLITSQCHVDIRIFSLQCLLQTMCDCKDNKSKPIREAIFTTLESLTNVVGAISENCSSVSTAGSGRPECEYELPLASSAMLQQLLLTPSYRGSNNASDLQEFFDRVALPALTYSRESNICWMRQFCRKYDLVDVLESLPIVPVDPSVWFTLFSSYLAYLPKSWLILFHEYFLFTLSPPDKVTAVNLLIKHDIELANGSESHWLRHYGEVPSFKIESLLEEEFPTGSRVQIDLKMIQDLTVEKAKAIIEKSTWTLETWQKFAYTFTLKHRGNHSQKIWLEQSRPVLVSIISYIEAARKSSRLIAPNKKPLILPPTFPLYMALIDFPNSDSDKELDERSCRRFAGQLQQFIETHVIGCAETPYHKRFEQLSSKVLAGLREWEIVHVVCDLDYLINFKNIKLCDYLLVDLADYLLNKAHGISKARPELLDQVVNMVTKWIQCDDELVCDLGLGWLKKSDVPWLANQREVMLNAEGVLSAKSISK
ncbi:LANO_0E13080g1_1 [Lachancea nothofagi CBS 11611]|uniref:LANO_0E13080g1_1 n=1 Tax=Lachancea nothofagi CBS 11611 TaxID=1266666 RepID=A0A1G4JYK5_9SACH|nr:LANO_0E13080g1_1 [Lachancea nothofagi CBS 11611]